MHRSSALFARAEATAHGKNPSAYSIPKPLFRDGEWYGYERTNTDSYSPGR